MWGTVGGVGAKVVTTGVLLGTAAGVLFMGAAGGRGEGAEWSLKRSSFSTKALTSFLTDWSRHPSATSLSVEINGKIGVT